MILKQELVNFLNEALKQDEEAITRVFLNINIPATQAMIDHPTVQVRANKTLRLIGLLNGLIVENNICIRMVIDDTGKRIMRFEIGTIY